MDDVEALGSVVFTMWFNLGSIILEVEQKELLENLRLTYRKIIMKDESIMPNVEFYNGFRSGVNLMQSRIDQIIKDYEVKHNERKQAGL